MRVIPGMPSSLTSLTLRANYSQFRHYIWYKVRHHNKVAPVQWQSWTIRVRVPVSDCLLCTAMPWHSARPLDRQLALAMAKHYPEN